MNTIKKRTGYYLILTFQFIFLTFTLSGNTSTGQDSGNWRRLADGSGIVALTSLDGKLYAISGDRQLVTLDPQTPGKTWKILGPASSGVSLAGAGGRLFLVSRDNKLWMTDPAREPIEWQSAGFATHWDSMTGAGGKLYASAGGKLWIRAAVTRNVNWIPSGQAPFGALLAATNERLYAVSRDGNLKVRDLDGIRGWKSLGMAGRLTALAIIGPTLFAIEGGGQTLVYRPVTRAERLAKREGFPVARANGLRTVRRVHPRPDGSPTPGPLWPSTELRRAMAPSPPPEEEPAPAREPQSVTPPPPAPTPPPRAVETPVPSAGEEGLFDFLDGAKFTARESGTGSSVRGDDLPYSMWPENRGKSPEQIRAEMQYGHDHLLFKINPNVSQTQAIIKEIARRIVRMEKSDPSPAKTLGKTWRPHYNEIRGVLLPKAQKGAGLMAQVQPKTEQVRRIQQAYLASIQGIETALRDWVTAIPRGDASLFQQGYAKIRQAESTYRAGFQESQKISAQFRQ